MPELTQNYFELFDLPNDFSVDKAILSEKYRQLQQVMHPDRFANSPDLEKRIALQQATLINEAFSTLKSPLLLAQYMLLLNGYDLNTETQTISDGMFLMQQMEMRESLAEVTSKTDPFKALDILMAEIKKAIADLVMQLDGHFKDVTEENMKKATELVGKLQFFNKLQFEAESIEAKLEDDI